MLLRGLFTRRYSHHPYSCDDEDRQADGKDHPRRHDGRQAISAANDTQRTQASLRTWRSADTISQGKQTYKYYNHKSWNQDSWLVISSLIHLSNSRLFQLHTELFSILLYTHHFIVFQYFWSFFPHLPKPALLYIQFQSNKTFRALCHIMCIFLHDDLLSFI